MLLTLIASGCTENDSTTISTSDGDVEYSVSEGAEDEWCPVGTTWQASNPQTREMTSMEIVGTETLDGVAMCKAVMETNTADEIAKMEYLWSENDETFKWTSYDATGKVVSIISMKDGKMTITDEEGKEIELGGMT
ncbi:MAG: hypothetical protein IBX40_08575 [Methanosarcinales archaeon]|nr:hypothetical protein [Methanosarcinales archaeon]